MKILIFGDIHGRNFWKYAIEKHINECDKIIFLGDYLDFYPDEEITRNQEKENFKEIIKLKKDNMENVILLLGNHDCHYFIKNFSRSTRYSSSNAYSYRNLFNKNKSLFKIAHEEVINDKKYLFTHAGLMNSWVDRNKEIIGEPTVKNLNSLLNFNNGIDALSEMSSYRSWFGEKSGSVLWSDVREKIKDIDAINNKITANEDSIVEGYDYQIFGHTRLTGKPIINDNWACVDCSTAFILDDGKLIECIDEKNISSENKS